MPLGQRYVVGLNEKGKSDVVISGIPNVQEQENAFWRATLWKTKEMPIDNTIEGDRSLDDALLRVPAPNGMLIRSLEFWPDPDIKTLEARMAEVNKMVGHDKEISEANRQRHPSMHYTDTLDFGIVLRGEITLLLDESEILLKQFDSVVVQGVNHGWANRGTEPCLLIGVLLDAKPRG